MLLLLLVIVTAAWKGFDLAGGAVLLLVRHWCRGAASGVDCRCRAQAVSAVPSLCVTRARPTAVALLLPAPTPAPPALPPPHHLTGGGARAGASEAAVALQLLTSAREAVDAGEHQQVGVCALAPLPNTHMNAHTQLHGPLLLAHSCVFACFPDVLS